MIWREICSLKISKEHCFVMGKSGNGKPASTAKQALKIIAENLVEVS